MAMAQAFQFELMLRQKDVIGEYVPLHEPGISAVVGPKGKWIMGLRWEEIDARMILRHTTSKRGKDIEVNLRLAPMVLEELALFSEVPIDKLTRADLPASGPVIECELTAYPWSTSEFRRKWRILATPPAFQRPSATWIAGPEPSARRPTPVPISSTSATPRPTAISG
jgi:hypothetical protein